MKKIDVNIPVNDFQNIEIKPKKPIGLYIGVIAYILIFVIGFIVIRIATAKKSTAVTETQEEVETLAPADSSIIAQVVWSKVKENTIVLTVTGLGGKYARVAYEISYESQGIVQGVTSRPVEVAGKDEFIRDDIYLGTCSKNVCKPHPGVSKVTLVLEFTDTLGKRSQLSKDFDL